MLFQTIDDCGCCRTRVWKSVQLLEIRIIVDDSNDVVINLHGIDVDSEFQPRLL